MSAEAHAVGRAGVALQFSDATSFRAWLERLPRDNLVKCHAEFALQVRLLPQASIRPALKLDLLEIMRETVAEVQRQYGEICWGRPVPLDAGDQAIWSHVVGLWRDLAAAYDSLILDLASGADEAHARAVTAQTIAFFTGAGADHH